MLNVKYTENKSSMALDKSCDIFFSAAKNINIIIEGEYGRLTISLLISTP